MEDWLKRRLYFNERPMLWGIPGTLLGALLALRLGGGALLGLGLAMLGLGVLLLVKGKAAYALPLLLGLLLLRGAVLPPVAVTPGVYRVTGVVADAPEPERGQVSLVLSRVRLDGRRVPGRLALTVPFDADLAYGDALSLEAWVAREDIHAVRALGAVRYGAQARGPLTVGPGRASALYGQALRWREKLCAAADRLFGDEAGVARGMLFGDRDDVHYLTFLAYRRSGLLHLLTVSGLHVGVVGGAVLNLIRGRRKWLRFLLSALTLLLFCLLTGLSPSSVRAAVMLLAVRFSRLLDRQADPLSAVGCALFLLLLVDPAFLLTWGFCLSFGAVWAMVCLGQPLRELLHSRHRGAIDLLAGSLAAFLGMLPLFSTTDSLVSWVGPLASLLALPAAPFFLIPGWIAVLLYPLVPAVAQAAALLPRGVLLYLDALAELVPVDGLLLKPCNPPALALWFAGMLFLSPYFLPNRRKPPYLGWGLMTAAALVWFLF